MVRRNLFSGDLDLGDLDRLRSERWDVVRCNLFSGDLDLDRLRLRSPDLSRLSRPDRLAVERVDSVRLNGGLDGDLVLDRLLLSREVERERDLRLLSWLDGWRGLEFRECTWKCGRPLT